MGRLRECHVLDVAEALGLETQESRGASGGSFACPVCGAETRHASRGDRRLACGVRGDGSGWSCFECGQSGGVHDLIGCALFKIRWRDLGKSGKENVRGWATTFLENKPTRTVDRPERKVKAKAPPRYPPVEDVAWLLAQCVRVDRDPIVAAWLTQERRLHPTAVAAVTTALALPTGTLCPPWATFAKNDKRAYDLPWSDTRFRCLFPLFDRDGVPRSVIARYAGIPRNTGKKNGGLKSAAARDHERRGLVLADVNGQRLLAGYVPSAPLRVIVCEGEMDVAAFSTCAVNRRQEALAVFGVFNGSWTREIVERIPDRATVLIATHLDPDGHKYAAEIERSLAGRSVQLQRWRGRSTDSRDANDYVKACIPLEVDGVRYQGAS